MYVSEICAEGIFVTFPWWLKNVKSRSKIALFSNERHFEIWFPKKRTITFFWSKLSKLHKKGTILHVANYIFPKTRGNKNNPWTHSTPLKVETLWFKSFIVFLENLVLGAFICADNESRIKEIGWCFRFWDTGVAKTTHFFFKSHNLPHKVIREVRQVNI